jgi:hypothetical protein
MIEALETKEVTLPGFPYRVRIEQLSALEARRLARRLMNAAGHALAQSASAGKNGASEDLLALAGLLETLDDETVDWLNATFLPHTKVADANGRFSSATDPGVEAMMFDGGKGLARWFVWMQACLMFTVADFFEGATALRSKLQELAATVAAKTTASPSPSTSPTSGSGTASFRVKRTEAPTSEP